MSRDTEHVELGEEDIEYHEHVANMLFLATILTFVVLTIYAFVYTNYRKRIKKYMALEVGVPGCSYYETDSEDSEDEIIIKEEPEAEQEEEKEEVKESILARL